MEKKNIIFTTLFTLIMFLGSMSAQSTEENLKKLFEFSKAKDYTSASTLIAYDGKDEARKLKDNFNYEDKDELNSVKRICKKLKALLDISDTYLFAKPIEKELDGKMWIVQEVQFNSGNQKLKTIFSFIKLKDKILLGDID